MSSTPPIRLAYLVSQYPAVNHTYILREIRGLRALGFEVSAVSIRPPDRPAAQLSGVEKEEADSTFAVLGAGRAAIAGAHLATVLRHPLGYLSGLASALRLAGADLRAAASNLFYFAEAVVAGRHCERLGVAHVHTHFSSTVALLLGRVFPIPCSATIHGPGEFDDAAGFYLREKVARMAFVRAISDYGASQLQRASDPEHWRKIEVVRLGVDTAVFSPGPAPAANGTTELLCVGSLAAPKGHAVLIAALDRVLKDCPSPAGVPRIHLRLAGEGPLRRELERMISERHLERHVTLEGACNQDRVLELYRQASLFALPSFAEGVPVVLMEAMAMEIPCLATGITGVPELIRHGVDGWLVPPGNEQELAAAIATLIGDAALRERLGKAGRVRVRAHYELTRNLQQLAEMFRRRLSA